jgi:hypothetical protein
MKVGAILALESTRYIVISVKKCASPKVPKKSDETAFGAPIVLKATPKSVRSVKLG